MWYVVFFQEAVFLRSALDNEGSGPGPGPGAAPLGPGPARAQPAQEDVCKKFTRALRTVTSLCGIIDECV